MITWLQEISRPVMSAVVVAAGLTTTVGPYFILPAANAGIAPRIRRDHSETLYLSRDGSDRSQLVASGTSGPQDKNMILAQESSPRAEASRTAGLKSFRRTLRVSRGEISRNARARTTTAADGRPPLPGIANMGMEKAKMDILHAGLFKAVNHKSGH